MANEQQMALLRRYPDIDLLPIDPADPDAVDRAVEEDAIGDTLFAFLWRELGDAESASAADLYMSMASGDVKEVLSGLESADEGEDPRAVLLRSYPGRSDLPIDLEDFHGIDQAVREDQTEDTLFSFLWRELGDAGDMEEARGMAERALLDIEAVAVAFEPAVSIGR